MHALHAHRYTHTGASPGKFSCTQPGPKSAADTPDIRAASRATSHEVCKGTRQAGGRARTVVVLDLRQQAQGSGEMRGVLSGGNHSLRGLAARAMVRLHGVSLSAWVLWGCARSARAAGRQAGRRRLP